MFINRNVCNVLNMPTILPDTATLDASSEDIDTLYTPRAGLSFAATVRTLATVRYDLNRLAARTKILQANARTHAVSKSAVEYGTDPTVRKQIVRVGFRAPGTQPALRKLNAPAVKKAHPKLYERCRVPKANIKITPPDDLVVRASAPAPRTLTLRQTIIAIEALKAERAPIAASERELKARLLYLVGLVGESWDPLGMVFPDGWNIHTQTLTFAADLFIATHPELAERYTELVPDPGSAGRYDVTNYRPDSTGEEELGEIDGD